MTDETGANTPSIFLIAGEPSGDILGARLMDGLQALSPNGVDCHGIGGTMMSARGLKSLFPISEIALMGISEILPHLPNLISRINEAVRTIKEVRPDVVVTIDSPGFCLRVAKKLKGSGIPVVHYVAPSVWAWKSWRAKQMSGYLDKVLALLHFEPPFFEKHGLPCEFVGHPVLESGANKGSAELFRKNFNVAASRRLLGVIPGSRRGEVTRHLPIIKETLEANADLQDNTDLVVPLAESVEGLVRDEMSGWRHTVHFVSEEHKYDAFAAMDAAVAASGTVSLELALAKVPFVTIYKMAPLSDYLARRVVELKYVNLINILLDEEVVPELLLESCLANLIAPKLHSLWTDDTVRQQQTAKFQDALKMLGAGDTLQSHRAAQAVLDVVRQPATLSSNSKP